ncbi:MAG: AgmX/PglI C-terminal domain-containing protein [Pseudomonadota bacterium]
MATPQIKLPSDPNSELYYDAHKLVVAFRARSAQKKAAPEFKSKVLRVVVQCYGWVIEDKFFAPGTEITVGAGKKNTFRIPTKDLPELHPLIEYRTDNSIRLTLNKHFSGVIQAEDRLKTLSDFMEGPAKPLNIIALKTGSRGCIEQGTVLIYFEEIPDPERVPPVAIFKNMADPYFARWFGLSLLLHLMLLMMIHVWPVNPQEITLEQLPEPFRKIIIQPQQIKPYVPKGIMATGLKAGPVGQEGEGERAPGAEGRRGRGVPGAGRRVSSKDITRTGVLDVFTRGGHNNYLNSLIGGGSGIPGDINHAFDRAARYGLPGERDLRSGKGLQGSGTGGGGRTESIGQGLGTKGKGGGAKGTGLADFGTGRSDTLVSASIDEEEVFIMGNIPKEVIGKIIEDHMGAIRYCYQRQLQVQPSLRGKITTDFVIGLEGRVTSTRVKRSTMGSPPVENCVLDVIRRLIFPKPGGGVVEVSYPFSFRVAG